jgi:hypothetical protein
MVTAQRSVQIKARHLVLMGKGSSWSDTPSATVWWPSNLRIVKEELEGDRDLSGFGQGYLPSDRSLVLRQF